VSRTVLILGCGIMQEPALRIASEMGWRVVAVDGNPEARGRHLAQHFFPVDLRDTEGIIEIARRLSADGGLEGVFTTGTDFSVSVARVAKAMNLPGHSLEAAICASDKARMRRRFQQQGVPSPPFIEINPAEVSPRGDSSGIGERELFARASTIPGPWVVKPADSMGARGVIRIDHLRELPQALETARSRSSSDRALLESYMEGPEYSLDALIEDGQLIRCGLADRHIVYPPRFIEIGHSIPADLSSETAEKLWNIFERGIEALGLSSGAAKGDIKLTPQGPMVGEIAARLSGGFMSGYTYPYASGIQPTRAALRLAVGLPASIPTPKKQLFCAERALISIDGTLKELTGVEKALSLPGVMDVFLHNEIGDRLSFPRSNVEKVANVIATAPQSAAAVNQALSALRCLELTLNPSDSRTGVYLDSFASFPPDAFDITEDHDFSQFLNKLWRTHPPRPSRGAPVSLPRILSPPSSRCTDYIGRSITDLLSILAGKKLIRVGRGSQETGASAFLSDFWRALIRGGLLGIRWYLEQASL